MRQDLSVTIKIEAIMISEKLQNAINDQITAELWSSNLYLQMAFYLEKESWNGFAHWMYKQSEEEKEHACALASYLTKRGGSALVLMIDVVPQGWGSVKEVFNNVADHERKISALINDLVDVANAENDKATQNFLWGFVAEQVEEENNADTIISRIEKCGDSGLVFLDAELAKR